MQRQLESFFGKLQDALESEAQSNLFLLRTPEGIRNVFTQTASSSIVPISFQIRHKDAIYDAAREKVFKALKRVNSFLNGPFADVKKAFIGENGNPGLSWHQDTAELEQQKAAASWIQKLDFQIADKTDTSGPATRPPSSSA